MPEEPKCTEVGQNWQGRSSDGGYVLILKRGEFDQISEGEAMKALMRTLYPSNNFRR